MIKELELFLNALERVTNCHYIQHLKIEPMLKPAFKKYTLTVHGIWGDDLNTVAAVEKIYRVTSDEEKSTASLNIAEELITKILENYEISKVE